MRPGRTVHRARDADEVAVDGGGHPCTHAGGDDELLRTRRRGSPPPRTRLVDVGAAVGIRDQQAPTRRTARFSSAANSSARVPARAGRSRRSIGMMSPSARSTPVTVRPSPTTSATWRRSTRTPRSASNASWRRRDDLRAIGEHREVAGSTGRFAARGRPDPIGLTDQGEPAVASARSRRTRCS